MDLKLPPSTPSVAISLIAELTKILGLLMREDRPHHHDPMVEEGLKEANAKLYGINHISLSSSSYFTPF